MNNKSDDNDLDKDSSDINVESQEKGIDSEWNDILTESDVKNNKKFESDINDLDIEQSSSLEDLPNNPPAQSRQKILLEKAKFYYKKSRILLSNLLDLKGIEEKIPEKWLKKLPENRRLVTMPLFILFLGLLFILILAIFAPRAGKQSDDKFLPIVRVVNATKENLRIPAYSQGIINPKHEIKLISLVNGPVIYVSPNFVDGGYVTEGELLLEISDRSYQQDRARVEANLAYAKSAQIAKQSELRVRGTLRTDAGVSQLRDVTSAVKAAEADLQKMDDLIASAKFKAPFSGLIRLANMQVGQMIGAGAFIGSIYSIDKAVVNLSLADRQLHLIDLPEISFPQGSLIEKIEQGAAQTLQADKNRKNQEITEQTQTEQIQTEQTQPILLDVSKDNFPKVKIIGDFDGKNYYWEGRLVRSAGGRNEINRLQYVIVEIDNPYGKDEVQPDRPPLSPGFFVQAEIEGRIQKDIIKLPRKALKPNQKIWAVDKDNYLKPLTVEIIHKGKDFIYVSSGIEDKTNIMISDLEVLAEGIQVKPVPILLEGGKNLGADPKDTLEKTTPKKSLSLWQKIEKKIDELK